MLVFSCPTPPMCSFPPHRQRRQQGCLPPALLVRLCWLLAVLVCLSNTAWLLARTTSLNPTTLIAAPGSAVLGWMSNERSSAGLGKTPTTAPPPYSQLTYRLVAGRRAHATVIALRRSYLLPAISKYRVLHRKIAPASPSDEPLLNALLNRAF